MLLFTLSIPHWCLLFTATVRRTHTVTRIVKKGRAQTRAHPHSCGLPPPAWTRHPPRPPVKQPHWRPTGTAQLPLNTKPQPVLLWNKSVVHRMALLIDPIYIISMYIQRSAEVSTLTQRHKAHETKNKRRNNRLFSWYVICWFLFFSQRLWRHLLRPWFVQPTSPEILT